MKVRPSNSLPVGVLTKVLSIFELLDHSPGGLQLRPRSPSRRRSIRAPLTAFSPIWERRVIWSATVPGPIFLDRASSAWSGSTYQVDHLQGEPSDS